MKLSSKYPFRFLSILALSGLTGIQLCAAQDKVDLVKLGEDKFKSVGCAECHDLTNDAKQIKTGPSLYSVFQQKPIKRAVIENPEKHLIKVTADLKYLKSSVREPAADLSINGAYSSDKEAIEKAYLPIMPAYNNKALTDHDIEAIWHYLKTQNEAKNAGPKSFMGEKAKVVKKTAEDNFNELIAFDRPLVVRTPVKTVSARAVHVGLPNGVNYTFDPRTLSFEQFWYGGFINSSEQTKNRATSPNRLGHKAQVIGQNKRLLQPLNAKGKHIDFSLSSPLVDDWGMLDKIIANDKDFSKSIDSIGAQFTGYNTLDDEVTFYYQVGKNQLTVRLEISDSRKVSIYLGGQLQEKQSFELGNMLKNVKTSRGKINGKKLVLNKSQKLNVVVTGTLPEPKDDIWRPSITAGSSQSQAVKESPLRTDDKGTDVLAGYIGTVIEPPKDRFGRDQLFEPTAMAVAKDGTIVVGTRTAGIWRIRDNQWTQFVDHSYECLGLVIEDDRGDKIVIAQKPELTRISDRDGDGRADLYETLADNFCFTGNYHEYMHGPVRDEKGNYYFNLNLGHYHRVKANIFKAGGKFMGTVGGYRGWMFKGSKRGEFKPYAHGLRSPAGLAIAPDQTIWYADNQGEFMGSSKLFKIKEGGNYGHPASAIDFPGMRRSSKEISNFSDWPKLKNWPDYPQPERAYGIFPHSDLANAPGSPVWTPKDGKFGILDGEMLCGDQTRSSLFSMHLHGTDKLPQTSFTPLFNKLPSGVMRLTVAPNGSLLVGQTGRGWKALGGQDASLVRLTWDGKTEPSIIKKVEGKGEVLEVSISKEFNKDLDKEALAKSIQVESYYYQSSKDYGSKKLEAHKEKIESKDVTVAGDVLKIRLDKGDYKLSKFGQRLFKVTLKDAKTHLDKHVGSDELSSYLSWTIK